MSYIDVSHVMRVLRDTIGLTVDDLSQALKSINLRTGSGYALVVNPVESRGIRVEGIGDPVLRVGYELAELVREFINRREGGEMPDIEKELTAFASSHGVIVVNISERDEAYLVIAPPKKEEPQSQ